MSIKDWYGYCREIVVRALTTTDVRTTLRNYLAAAFAGGFLVGAMASALWAAIGLLAALIFGGALGYATRSYVSYRRRETFRRRHER